MFRHTVSEAHATDCSPNFRFSIPGGSEGLNTVSMDVVVDLPINRSELFSIIMIAKVPVDTFCQSSNGLPPLPTHVDTGKLLADSLSSSDSYRCFQCFSRIGCEEFFYATGKEFSSGASCRRCKRQPRVRGAVALGERSSTEYSILQCFVFLRYRLSALLYLC